MNFSNIEALLKTVKIIFLSLIISIVPMIIYLHPVILLEDTRLFWGTLVDYDFVSFYKMNWLLIFGFILLMLFLFDLARKNIRFSYYYLPILIYGLFTVFSSITSDLSDVVLLGFPIRYENVFVIIMYLIILIIAFNIVYNKKSTKFVLIALMFSSLLLGIHGILQFIGLDFFNTEIGRRLITPSGLEFFVDNFSFLNKNRIYSTMGNPNYAGSYGAMVVPLFLGFYFTIKQKREIYTLGFLSVLMFAYLNGTKSRAGFVGFLVGLIFLLFLNRKIIIRNWKRTVLIFFAFTIVFVAMDVRSVDEIFKDIISPMSEEKLVEEELILPPITNVESDINHLVLETSEVGFNIYFDNDTIQIFDNNNNELFYNYNEEEILYFEEDKYTDHKFRKNSDENQLIWNYANKEAVFKYQDEQVFMQGMNNNLYEIKEVPSWGFEGYERLGSSRGYIWSRSIPLLKNTIFIGHGPDTYAMYFPQEDVVGKLKYLRSPRIMVDKPHNMYLQIAINTGVLSLISLLVLWTAYIIQGIRIYWKSDFESWESRVGVAILGAVVSYLVTGMFNDSVVAVAPVFWILLGIGISMNTLITRKT